MVTAWHVPLRAALRDVSIILSGPSINHATIACLTINQFTTEQEAITLSRANTLANEQTGLEPEESLVAEGNPANEVAEFAEAYNLNDKLDHLQKATLLIQGIIPIPELPTIAQDEIKSLQAETENKWRQPLHLYLTITVTATGAMGQGWAQTSVNGASSYFPKAFGIDTNSPKNNLILGMINSGIYLSNGLLSAWLVSPLNK